MHMVQGCVEVLNKICNVKLLVLKSAKSLKSGEIKNKAGACIECSEKWGLCILLILHSSNICDEVQVQANSGVAIWIS